MDVRIELDQLKIYIGNIFPVSSNWFEIFFMRNLIVNVQVVSTTVPSDLPSDKTTTTQIPVSLNPVFRRGP